MTWNGLCVECGSSTQFAAARCSPACIDKAVARLGARLNGQAAMNCLCANPMIFGHAEDCPHYPRAQMDVVATLRALVTGAVDAVEFMGVRIVCDPPQDPRPAKNRLSDLDLHRLAQVREAAGICEICVREHAQCDCHKDGDGGKTRRDVYEATQRRLRGEKQ